MKPFILCLLLIIFTTAILADTTCVLSRSGIQEEFIFEDYSQSIVPDFENPACQEPVGRLGCELKLKKATLLFPRGIRIVHETFESIAPHYKPYTSRLVLYKGCDWIQTYTGKYDPMSSSQHISFYFPPKFFRQFGEVLDGGYTLECKERI